jgi:Mg-chelatase subunit ChlD
VPVKWEDARRCVWIGSARSILGSLWTAAVGDSLAGFVADDTPAAYGDEVSLADAWRFVRPSESDLAELARATDSRNEQFDTPRELARSVESSALATGDSPPARFDLAVVPVHSAIELDVLATYAVSLPYALRLPAVVAIRAQGHGLDEMVTLSPTDPRVGALVACFMSGTPLAGLLVDHLSDGHSGVPLRPWYLTSSVSGATTIPVGTPLSVERLLTSRDGADRTRVVLQRAGAEAAPTEAPPTGPVQKSYACALARWSSGLADACVHGDDLPVLAVGLARALRDDARLARKPGVRAATALAEVAEALGAARGKLTRSDIEEAAQITLTSRVAGASGATGASRAVRESSLLLLYGIETRPMAARSSRSRDSIAENSDSDVVGDALLRLWQTTHQEHDCQPGNTRLDLTRPESVAGSEALRSALRSAARRLGVHAEKPAQSLADYLVGRGLLRQEADGSYALTAPGADRLRQAVLQERRSGRLGQIEASALLAQLDGLDLSPLSAGMLGGSEAIRRVLHDVMDAQDSIWSGGVTAQQMAVHYLRRPQGGAAGAPGLRYHTIRAIVDELAARGYLTPSSTADGMTLTAEAVRLISVDAEGGATTGQLSWRGPKTGSHDGARIAIRRWRPGDVQRDVDLRATVGAAALAGRTPANAERDDLNVSLRASGAAPDTILCVDVSGSMGRDRKLASARTVAAAIANETIKRGGRVGVVAFDDAARPMSGLTRNPEEAFSAIACLRAGANTNVADGLRSAGSLANGAGPGTRVVLLSDGLPSAVSASKASGSALPPDLCERLATVEARRIARSGSRLSVLLIGDEGPAATRFARRLALAGRGEVRRLRR